MLAYVEKAENIVKRPVFQYIALIAITAFAFVLRFYKLDVWSFWVDELTTVYAARDILSNFSLDLTTAILNHPFTSILIHFVFNIFGISELSARLAPLIIGVLSIPILYFPVRKVYGVPVALLFSIMLAVSRWHLYWSQNARFYVMLLLLFSLALFAFYFAMEEDRPGYVILFFIAYRRSIY